MGWWVYFASTAKAGAADTFMFAREHQVMSRPVHTEDGSALIPNVSQLSPGDSMLLVYRGRLPHRARLVARIASPRERLPGFKAIEKISGELAQEMDRKGYPLLPGGTQEVIRLEWVQDCDLELRGRYGGRNAIHRIDPADRAGMKELLRPT